MKYNRTFNFSAGPAMMPEAVLEEIRDEMMNYRGSGMCVMEMSHRSKVFQQIVDEAEADLRELMGIPDNYKVLFVQGGGTLAVCHGADEPDEKRRGLLCRDGHLVEEGHRGGEEVRRRHRSSPPPPTRTISYIPDCSDLRHPGRCRLCLHLRERDHQRHDVAQAAEHEGA